MDCYKNMLIMSNSANQCACSSKPAFLTDADFSRFTRTSVTLLQFTYSSLCSLRIAKACASGHV